MISRSKTSAYSCSRQNIVIFSISMLGGGMYEDTDSSEQQRHAHSKRSRNDDPGAMICGSYGGKRRRLSRWDKRSELRHFVFVGDVSSKNAFTIQMEPVNNARGFSIMRSAMQETYTLSHNTTEPDQLMARTPHCMNPGTHLRYQASVYDVPHRSQSLLARASAVVLKCLSSLHAGSNVMPLLPTLYGGNRRRSGVAKTC